MNNKAMNDLVKQYIKYLENGFQSNKNGDWEHIQTPFLDRHNDRITVFVKQLGDKIYISEDGYILGDFYEQIRSIPSIDRLTKIEKRYLFCTILDRYNVVENVEIDLVIEADIESFAIKFNNFLMCILAINSFCKVLEILKE